MSLDVRSKVQAQQASIAALLSLGANFATYGGMGWMDSELLTCRYCVAICQASVNNQLDNKDSLQRGREPTSLPCSRKVPDRQILSVCLVCALL